MLNEIDQMTFNEKLSPDIIISVGGKSLMNDPLTFKIRNGLQNIRHWSVIPNGKFKDFYFRSGGQRPRLLWGVVGSTQIPFEI